MKNRLYQILAFCCGLALLFPLAACQTGETQKAPLHLKNRLSKAKLKILPPCLCRSSPSSSKLSWTVLAEEYDGRLEKDAVIDVINEKKAGAIPEEYHSDLGRLSRLRSDRTE